MVDLLFVHFPYTQRINEKVSVVSEYESGRAIPNQQIIAKMERVLGKPLYLINQHHFHFKLLITRCSPARREGGTAKDYGAWQAILSNSINSCSTIRTTNSVKFKLIAFVHLTSSVLSKYLTVLHHCFSACSMSTVVN